MRHFLHAGGGQILGRDTRVLDPTLQLAQLLSLGGFAVFASRHALVLGAQAVFGLGDLVSQSLNILMDLVQAAFVSVSLEACRFFHRLGKNRP